MCVIVYKPAGVDMPSNSTLHRCFQTNPDGAGFMYPIVHKDKVRIRKGFMSIIDFDDAITELGSHLDLKDIPLVMHFRIGTQGNNDEANCHPFPISKEDAALTATSAIADVALVHNGIIDLTSSYRSSYINTKNKEQYSDTFYFVRDYATLIINDHKYHENNDMTTLLLRLADSKLAIMGKDGHVEMLGGFVELEDGCHYSNISWQYQPTRGYSSWGSSSIYGDKSGIGDYMGRAWYDDDDKKDWEGDPKARLSLASAQFDSTDEDMRSLNIAAAFVPERYHILDEADGTMYPADSDNFVYDQRGHVYMYSNDLNAVFDMPDLSVIDTWDYDYHEASRDECVMFTLFVDDETRVRDYYGCAINTQEIIDMEMGEDDNA